jgi:tetratricopeptide (TPR) repeat protein
MSVRLETLQKMAEQDPTSSFIRYGLAMELMNLGRAGEALEEFRTLLNNDPNYSAAYFHGGRALETLGLVEEAREMYRTGIEVTGRNGDAHTRGELEAALDLLG